MSNTKTLPVLPLRETVVFPGVAVPIGAGRPGTLEAVEKALKDDSRMFAVCQRENVDEATPEILYGMGVIVRIVQAQRGPAAFQLLIQGEQRARAQGYESLGEGALQAEVVPVADIPPVAMEPAALEALDRELRERALALGRKRGIPEEALSQFVRGVSDPGAFADLVSFYLEMPAADKQSLLELQAVDERMRRVLVAIERDLVRLEAQEEIQQKVQEELGDKQREIVLREQLKAIQKELGEDEETSDLAELEERLASLDLTEEARSEVDRELNRLRRTHPQSAEYQVIRTYLDVIADLPWNERTEDKIDLAAAQEILDHDHYGLEDVKDRVIEFLAVRKLQMEHEAEQAGAAASGAAESVAAETEDTAEARAAGAAGAEEGEGAGGATNGEANGEGRVEAGGAAPDGTADGETGAAGSEAPRTGRPGGADGDAEGKRIRARAVGRGPILLFVGPPGVGKTSVAQSIARALGRKYVRIALGGARDEADIRGHRRTYVGAMPGRIMQGLKQAGTKNPVFLLDEVDKLGVSLQGDPSSALLEVLDPAQNHSFTDHYLGVPFDLSEVLFIATANYLDRIPAPLLDRMETVEFAGYTEQEKLEIAKRYLLPRQERENGLTAEDISVADEAVRRVISEYTREAGVRQLERELGKLARKAARRIAAEEADRVVIERDDVPAMLGRRRVHPERAAAEDAVGVATGMYYTPMGGDIMFVEASFYRGKEGLLLTGHLGDVMKESARAALTYAKTHHDRLGIPDENMTDVEMHVHVPAGAIPKDGPSAGVTMATAIVSALSDRPARHDVAMTGEITLTGKVLPIGGVKEKVLGAHRAGIREIILPADNEADLDDLPEDVREELTLHLVSDLGEVLAIALRGASLREGSLVFASDTAPTMSGGEILMPHEEGREEARR